jgi:hypothetical protein
VSERNQLVYYSTRLLTFSSYLSHFYFRTMHVSSTTLLLGAMLATEAQGKVQEQGKVQVVPTAQLAPATYHSWAHKHWVWLHHGVSNQQNATDIVDG